MHIFNNNFFPHRVNLWHTCNHTSNSSQIGPISFMLSTEQHDVVPTVVDTKNGTSPFLVSSSIAYNTSQKYYWGVDTRINNERSIYNEFHTLYTVSPLRQKFSSVSRILNLVKAIMEPFSKHEWASLEQYAINLDNKTPSSAVGFCFFNFWMARARAANIETKTHSLALVYIQNVFSIMQW